MSQTVRTNLATNPAGATTTNYAALAGTGGTAALSNQTSGGAYGATFNRVTWSVATSAVSGGATYTEPSGIAASTTYAIQVWVRSSVAQTVQLNADFRNASNTIVNTVTGSSVALTAATWTKLTVVGTSGAAVTNIVLTVQAVTGGVNWAAGNTLDIDAVLLEAPPVARTNLVQNPSPSGTGTGWAAAMGGGTGTVTFGAVSGFPSANAATVSWSTAAASGWNVQCGQANGGSAFPISGGAVITGSLSGKHSWAGATSRVTFDFFDAGGVHISYDGGTPVTIAANTVTRLSYTATAPANAAKVQVFWDAGGGTLPPAGATAVVGAALIEVSPILGAYFDGSTAETSTTLYGWTGAANASTSVALTTPFTYFDGSFTNAGAVMYARTGAANASTSTATTYVPAIALAPATDSPCPRVVVTLTDLTPTDNVVNLWRTADGARTPVRGTSGLTVNGSTALTDYEAPLGRSVAYDLEIVSGVSLGAVTPTSTTTVTPPLDAAGKPTWWIQDPLVPGTAVALSVNKRGANPSLTAAAVKALEYASDIAVIPIMGSNLPIAIGGQRMAAAGVDFSTFTNTAQQTTNLRNLLAGSSVLLIRPPGNRNDGIPGLMYTAAPKATEQPVTVAFGGTLTRWTLTGTSVAAPTAAILVPVWTYGAVQNLWATYQQAQTALASKTYLAVLKSPTGA